MDALIDERLREIEEREKESKYMNEKLREKWEAFEANRSKLEGKFNEVKLKSEELECRIKNLELIEVECDERVRQAGLKEKRLLEWSKELKIQKRELEVRLREVELKDNRVNELKRDLEVRLSEDELKDNRIKELKRDLEMRLREVELKDNSIKELSKELDLRSKKRVEENINVRPGISNLSDEIHMKVLAKSPDTCLDKDGQVSNIQKHTIADGKDLQIFLNERWTEGEKLRYEVSATLRKCPDPARLVLDAMEGFYSPHLKKGSVEFDECNVRSCILLLEQLMKISPIISPQVKTEATKLSFFWITKMRADARNSLEVLGFLQLLATYGLASAFDTDEILHYVEKIAHFRHMPELCQALGLKDKIPGFIRNLVKDNKRDVAVSFIYAFKMEKDFPPEPLLKDHMGISKNAAGEILQNGHNSPEAQNHTIRAKVDDLKTRGRCFEDRKIKSTISHENIKEAFTSVEKKDWEPEKAATEIGRIKMRELDGKLHSPAIVAAPFPSSIPASYKTAPAITIETSVQPPPQTSARPQHRGKHPQTAALAEAGSNPFASPSADAQTSHITHKGIKVPIAVLGAEIDEYCSPELLKQFEEVLAAKPEKNQQVYQKGKGKATGGRGRTRGGGVVTRLFDDDSTPAATSTPSLTLWTEPGEESPMASSQHESQLAEEGQHSDLQNVLVEPQLEVGQSYTTRGNPDNEHNWILDNEGRKLIEPLGDSFKKGTQVLRDLYRIVNDHWGGPYTCFTSTPEYDRRLWWQEFSRKYFWAPHHNGEVRRIYHKKVGDHMRNVMNKAKKNKKRPAWISVMSWEQIVRKWNSEEHKQASARNSQNRSSSSRKFGMATYAGGSISIGEHKSKLAKVLGRPPSYSETFERTFVKKDKTFVSDRAKTVKDKFEELLASTPRQGNSDGEEGANGTLELSQADQTKMWLEASGAVTQGKVYGLGSLARECAKSVGASSFGTVSSRCGRSEKEYVEEVAHLKSLVEERVDKIKSLEQKGQDTDNVVQAMQRQLNMLMQAQLGRPLQLHDQAAEQPPHPLAPRAEDEHLDGDQDDDLSG